MNTTTIERSPRLPRRAGVAGSSNAGIRLVSLVAACVASLALAGLVGDPRPMLLADPELARLLRGMAAIKGLVAVAAVAAVGWRFARHGAVPTAASIAAGYVVGTAAMAGATALVWQLSSLVVASAAFHGGLLLVLVVAWRDDQAPLRRGLRRSIR